MTDAQMILGMVAALAVLIMVHEYGHYRMAVACGVKVLRFSFGFGRVLLRRQKTPESTEFVLSALPLGGYVRMLGDTDPVDSPEDRARTLNGRPLWQRALVVAAGPAANLLLAVVLFAGARLIGTQEPAAVLAAPPAGTLMADATAQRGDVVLATGASDDDAAAPMASVDWREARSMNDVFEAVARGVIDHRTILLRVRRAGGEATRDLSLHLERLESRDLDRATALRIGLDVLRDEPLLGAPESGSPAAAAGVRDGDRVLSVEDTPVADGAGFVARVRGSVAGGAGVPLHVVVERAGQPVPLVLVPRVVHEGGVTFGRIGVAVGRPQLVTVRDGPADALLEGVRRTGRACSDTLAILRQMLAGHASTKNLSGPITVVTEAGHSAQRGFASYIAFLASISVGLGILNLLPLPILDGGTLLYYLFEGVTGRPVTELWLARLQRGGLVLLLLLMSLALSNDVARLLGLQ